jgi:hypothetical protein
VRGLPSVFVMGAVHVASRIPAILGFVPTRTPLRRRLRATHVAADPAVFLRTVVSLRGDHRVPEADRTLLLQESGCRDISRPDP